MLDVSWIAARRRAVWGGGAAVVIVGMCAGGLTVWGAYAGIGVSTARAEDPYTTDLRSGVVALGLGGAVVVLSVVLSRALRRGRPGAGLAALALATVMAGVCAVGLVLADTTGYASMAAAVGAWCGVALVRAGVAVQASARALRLLAALAALALAIGAGASFVQAAGGARLTGTESWALVCMPMTAFLGVRMTLTAGLGAHRPQDEPASFAGWERVTTSVARGIVNRVVVASGLYLLVPLALLPLLFLGEGVLWLPLAAAQSAVTWLAASKWIRLGRQFAGLDGPFSRVWSARGSVLYLRSFRADRTRITATPVRYLLDWRGRTYLEEAVARGLRPYGRVVAAAEPMSLARARAPLGATRKRLDENWQSTLHEWMCEAELIVSTTGTTEGFLWELRRVIDLRLTDKLAFVLPPGTAAAEWEPVAELFADALPRHVDPARVRAVVPGDPPRLIVSRGTRDFDYEVAVELAAQLVLDRRAGGRSVEPSPAVTAAVRRRARVARNVGIAAIVGFPLPFVSLVVGAVALALAADAAAEIARGGIKGARDATLGRRLGLIGLTLSATVAVLSLLFG